MKKLTTLRMIALVCALTMAAATALADTALVVTENKGKLNLRKSPTTDSKRIAQIPNLTTIEILDVDGDWAKATYNEKTGFVMTKFLRIASQLAGKTVYDDDYGLVLLRGEASAAAPAVMPADNLAGVAVESVDNGWAAVSLDGETTLYADASQFTYQIAKAPGAIHWIAEPGTIEQDCALRLTDGSLSQLAADTEVTVTELSGSECLVFCDAGCGYVPMSAVHLSGPADTGEEAGSASPATAQKRAMEALRKNYKGVANELLTPAVAVYQNVYGEEMPFYHCGFFNADGEYAYGALVSAQNATVIYTARYDAFAAAQAPVNTPDAENEPAAAPEPDAEPVPEASAAPEPDAEPAPEAEATDSAGAPQIIVLTMDGSEQTQPEAEPETLIMEPVDAEPAGQTEEPLPEQPAETVDPTESAAAEAAAAGDAELAFTGDIELGDVEDIEISAWTDYGCAYTITKDGQPVASSGQTTHFSAAFRPREAGQYKLNVTITDENGAAASMETEFTVQEADLEGVLYDLYSQEDGWWTGTDLGTGTMAQQGAPLFALAHALSRVGVDSTDMLPENLAVNENIAASVLENGVDNARLIKIAAEMFGFKTQDEPLTDAGKIAELLKSGAVFSFANEKGNVVLATGISEDGTLVQIIDSAPGKSFDEIPSDAVFLQQEDGSFAAMQSLDDDPYIRWYFETGAYGASEYWMKLDAVAPQGLLLIQPAEE